MVWLTVKNPAIERAATGGIQAAFHLCRSPLGPAPRLTMPNLRNEEQNVVGTGMTAPAP
ncbi:MAG: hypothetical protein ACFB0G_20370 [Leptolyngbyaceae cyanobacterium]